MDKLKTQLQEYGITLNERYNLDDQHLSMERIINTHFYAYVVSNGADEKKIAIDEFVRHLIKKKLALMVTEPKKLIEKLNLQKNNIPFPEFVFIDTALRWYDKEKRLCLANINANARALGMMEEYIRDNIEHFGEIYPDWKMKHLFEAEKAELELANELMLDRVMIGEKADRECDFGEIYNLIKCETARIIKMIEEQTVSS